MSLQTQLNSFVLRVAEEFNTVKGRTGTLTALTTTDKTSLVAAINELKAAILTAVAIDDLTVATTSTYSSSKIVSVLDALKADILGGADPAYDTLLELQQALQNDQTGIAALARQTMSGCLCYGKSIRNIRQSFFLGGGLTHDGMFLGQAA